MQIASGSMKDAGFSVGEYVVVKKTDTDQLKVKDYIAFYSCLPTNASSPSHATAENLPVLPDNLKETKIIFHEIVAISNDSNGHRWFTTKGTNNESADSFMIYDLLVIGKYAKISAGTEKLLNFSMSPLGRVMVVVGIASILASMYLYQIIITCFELQGIKKNRNKLKGKH